MKSKYFAGVIVLLVGIVLLLPSASAVSPFSELNVTYPDNMRYFESKYIYTDKNYAMVYWDYTGGESLRSMDMFNGTIINTINGSVIFDLDGRYFIYRSCSANLAVAVYGGHTSSENFLDSYLKYMDLFCTGDIPKGAYTYLVTEALYDGRYMYLVDEVKIIFYDDWAAATFNGATFAGNHYTNDGKEMAFYRTGHDTNYVGIYNGSRISKGVVYAVQCATINNNCLNLLNEKEQISMAPVHKTSSTPISVILYDIVFIILFIFLLLLPPYLYGLAKEKKISKWWHTKTYVTLALSVGLVVVFYLVMLSISSWLFLIFIAAPVIIVWTTKDRGIPLSKRSAPGLFKIVNDLAKKVGVKPPRDIMLTPDTGIGVRGFFRKKLFIGYGALMGLNVSDLQNILAHELSHLKGFDTIIGGGMMTLKAAIGRAVYLLSFIRRISIGFIIWLPMWLYYEIYSLFILAYSRQREFIADRRAAFVVGPKSFAKSLEKYIDYSYLFDVATHRLVLAAIFRKKVFKNIYATFLKWEKTSKDKIKEIKEAKKAKKLKLIHKLFSTHPEDDKRLKVIYDMKDFKVKHLPGKAVSLIKNRQGLEERLTKMYTTFALRRAGLKLVKKKK